MGTPLESEWLPESCSKAPGGDLSKATTGGLRHINHIIHFSWHYPHSRSQVKERNSQVRFSLPVMYVNLNRLPKKDGLDQTAVWPIPSQSPKRGDISLLLNSSSCQEGLPARAWQADGWARWCNGLQRWTARRIVRGYCRHKFSTGCTFHPNKQFVTQTEQ